MKRFIKCLTILLTIFMIRGMKVYAYEITRIEGTTRYETAIKVSKEFDKADTIILVRGDDFPDAISATPLASKYKAPILLTEKNKLRSDVKEEIKRLGAKKVIIIGGTSAVTEGVEKELKKLNISIERISGSNRYETSEKIAQKIGYDNGAFIVTGKNYPDALSVGPIAAISKTPIILVGDDYNGKTDIENLVVVGGVQAVPYKILNKLRSYKWVNGENRYATNFLIINQFREEYNLDSALIATGENYPDALSSGALAAKNKNPIILVPKKLNDGIKTLLLEETSNYKIIGGKSAVNDEVEKYLKENQYYKAKEIKLDENNFAYEVEKKFTEKLNAKRVEKGLSKLINDKELNASARENSDFLYEKNVFFDRNNVFYFISRGVPGANEDILADFFIGVMLDKSYGYDKAFNSNYTKFGVSAKVEGYSVYFVMEFSK